MRNESAGAMRVRSERPGAWSPEPEARSPETGPGAWSLQPDQAYIARPADKFTQPRATR
jgi:hypothetical protein